MGGQGQSVPQWTDKGVGRTVSQGPAVHRHGVGLPFSEVHCQTGDRCISPFQGCPLLQFSFVSDLTKEVI